MASTDPVRPVQEIRPIAQGSLGVLIDCHDDCLHMVIAIAFEWGLPPCVCERLDPSRIVSIRVEPLRWLVGHCTNFRSDVRLLAATDLPRASSKSAGEGRIVKAGTLELESGRRKLLNVRTQLQQQSQNQRIAIHDTPGNFGG